MKAIKQYYYSDSEKTFGPFKILELKQFGITKETLVWFEGLDGWKPAGELNEMKAIITDTTPSINLEKKVISTKNDDVLIDFTQNKKGFKRVMFSNSFSFSGRIRRLEYGLSFIIYIFLLQIIQEVAIQTPIIGILAFPLIWFLLAQGTKRCHDIGKSGWWQIIPFFILWMFFENGHSGLNKYGFNPKD